MRKTTGIGLSAVMATLLAAGTASADTIKIAFIDPLSGPFASTGTNGLHQYEFAAETLVNEKGGVLDGDTFEIVAFDNKTSPKESLVQLQVAIDQGIRYVVQGNSSGVAHALTDAIEKHNRRNPDDRVLFLNYSAVDPALTNENCNFWHFRFDANADIKMDALTDVIAEQDDITKVYVIGQDYSFGKAVSSAATSFLGEKRPDIEIVGNELHPIGKVKDFTPYSRKIVSSGADAVITGNWGADMLNLGKSVIDNGFDGPIYTYYAAADGITAAFGESGKDRLRLVTEGQTNPPPNDRAAAYIEAFKAKYPDGNMSQTRITNVIEMLAKAINEAGTATDVVAVGEALEGMEHESMWGGTLYMRPEDHQLIQDVLITVHTNEGIDYDLDNSDYGQRMEHRIEMAGMDSPTTCKMRRP
ncbi:branched-chain amino acid ABC transporter substrate-binding protein [Marinibacterium profundimaris]|uniref:Branched-chain amino acid ABC transporter substrate-binding protein n=1 Tax=Marinibacterium profundimaris TaxID=1679460 RepID=A0A225NQZ6_9RHOB|nr:branched-chain amino acid ABC transporter substrate-binding protein [Marinibacterium profundimaris]OWU77305.1 branched-chain amino acid ABC transporter substrate-binding protein [Marinibacterium profundimaris]